MGRKRFTAEQIINMLREAEVLLNQGSSFGVENTINSACTVLWDTGLLLQRLIIMDF